MICKTLLRAKHFLLPKFVKQYTEATLVLKNKKMLIIFIQKKGLLGSGTVIQQILMDLNF